MFCSKYLNEFYTRCIVFQMKKVHDKREPINLVSMFKLLGYEEFSEIAVAETKKLIVVLEWTLSISVQRIDPISAAFLVFFYFYKEYKE